jgi:zinc transport system substrate-binding protein
MQSGVLSSCRIFFFGLLLVAIGVEAQERLRIGVTLHPYYSWTQNIVGEQAEVIPLLPSEVDPHSYQPQPEDIQRLVGLDAVVMNGMGHDAFLEPMLKAAGNLDLHKIDLHRDVPLIQLSGTTAGSGQRLYNSHTFLSITSAVHQLHNLSEELTHIDPANGDWYRKNTRSYKARLRKHLAAALQELSQIDHREVKVGTVHEGYNYLFQDLGLQVEAIVQPRHGIRPSAKQLADTIRRLKQSSIDILFTEMDYEARYVELIQQETEVRLARLTHISKGEYAADAYENQMVGNLRRVVDTIKAVR